MDDAKKNKIEENIDRMAREWYLSKLSNENEGKTLKLRNAIWEEMTKLRFSPDKTEIMDEQFSEEWIVFMDTLEEITNKFQPDVEKSSFTHFFSSTYKYRLKDAKNDKKDPKKNVSVDQEGGNDSERSQYNPKIQLKDKSISDPSESLVIVDFLVDMMGLILNFSDKHKGKANNSRKKLWYHIFYTEDITVFSKQLYKEKTRVSNNIHKTDIFRVMRQAYLNFYMSNPCNSIEEIAYTPLKNYEEIIQNPLEDQIGMEIPSKRKIPAEVSIQYLNVCENIKVSDSARSNQKSEYDAEKRGLLL